MKISRNEFINALNQSQRITENIMYCEFPGMDKEISTHKMLINDFALSLINDFALSWLKTNGNPEFLTVDDLQEFNYDLSEYMEKMFELRYLKELQ